MKLVATMGDNCLDRYLPPLEREFVGGNALNVAVGLRDLGPDVAEMVGSGELDEARPGDRGKRLSSLLNRDDPIVDPVPAQSRHIDRWQHRSHIDLVVHGDELAQRCWTRRLSLVARLPGAVPGVGRNRWRHDFQRHRLLGPPCAKPQLPPSQALLPGRWRLTGRKEHCRGAIKHEAFDTVGVGNREEKRHRAALRAPPQECSVYLCRVHHRSQIVDPRVQ